MSCPQPHYELDERVVEPKETKPPVRHRMVARTFELEPELLFAIGISVCIGWVGFLAYKMLWFNPWSNP